MRRIIPRWRKMTLTLWLVNAIFLVWLIAALFAART